jgi:hypothetical protein
MSPRFAIAANGGDLSPNCKILRIIRTSATLGWHCAGGELLCFSFLAGRYSNNAEVHGRL